MTYAEDAERRMPFRAGLKQPQTAEAVAARLPVFTGNHVLMADVSEFEPDITDPVYLQWSKAIIIRAAYGTSHEDHAWYGGQRRQLLHDGGARFLGIYQYLVAGQSGAAQADALHNIVGSLQPGEVIIADYEEGNHKMLSDWFGEMIRLGFPHKQTWAYSYPFFGLANSAFPCEWVASYSNVEPTAFPLAPHVLWQFTAGYKVPGVPGWTDASVYHGSIDQLAALAYQPVHPPVPPPPPPHSAAFTAPRAFEVHAGDTTVRVDHVTPPATCPGPVHHYRFWVYKGSYPSDRTLMATYPRTMTASPAQFGGLGGVPSGTHMTARIVAYTKDGQHSAYADAHFVMPLGGAMNLSDTVVSYIRTYVPAAVGLFIGWLVSLHLTVDPNLQAGLTALLSGAAITVWYAAVRWLEARWKVFGWLLGTPKQPTYADPYEHNKGEHPRTQPNEYPFGKP